MRFQMIDRDQRLVVHQRDRLGHGQADDDAADQAGPAAAATPSSAAKETRASAIALAMM
jgi:hypothetical protein